MTRAEHLAWAKRRALEYVDADELPDAIASFTSDMSKHPEIDQGVVITLAPLAFKAANEGDAQAMRRWIEGFN